MDFQLIELGDANKLALKGRLDTTGVAQIETRFIASVVPSGRNAIVDLSGVDFVSSMGIRMLIMTARSLGNKKARMVLYGAQPLVRESLESVAIGAIVPFADDEADAIGMLGS